MKRMQPKWVLFDNVELPEVRRAVKEAGLCQSTTEIQSTSFM